MIKGTKSYRDQILQHWISRGGYPQNKDICILFLLSVSYFWPKPKKTKTQKTKRTTVELCPLLQLVPAANSRACLFPSPSLWSSPAISLAITQPAQQNQSVLNFSWDLGDLLMNLQRGEKLTVLSYAWCC